MLKKNIAKLLVFAMILSMLPFSAVTAGATNARTGETLSDYVTVSDVKVGTNTLDPDADDFSYKMAEDAKVSAGQVTVEFKAKLLNGATGLVIKHGTDTLDKAGNDGKGYSVEGDTYTVKYDVTIAESATGTQTEKFTLEAVKNGTLATGSLTLTLNVPKTEEPPVDDGESVYRIKMDATATVEVGKTVELKATPEYRIATDVNENAYKPATDTAVTFASDAPSIATVAPDGTVTGVAAGDANITATWTKDTSITAKCAVTVTAAAGGYTIKFDASPAKGTVSVAVEGSNVVSESTKVQSGKTVTITAKATDPTYALNMDTFGVYKVSDDVEAAKYTSVGNDAYTFVMPDCNVKITAEFTLVKPETIEVEVEMNPITDVKTGFTLPKPVSLTDGVYVDVKWTDPDSNVVTDAEVYEKVGTYTYEFTAKSLPDYKVISDVKYVLNDKDMDGATGTVDVTARKLEVSYGSDPISPALGYLTIKGTSAAKYYVISETKTNKAKTASATAYVVVKGDGTTGTLKIPVVSNATLNVTEQNASDNSATEKTPIVSLQTTKDGPIDTVDAPSPASVSTYALNDSVASEVSDTPDSSGEGLSVSYGSDPISPALGYLTINGTSATKYYVISETKTNKAKTASATAYVVVKGNGGTLKVPVISNATLNVTEQNASDNNATEKKPIVSLQTTKDGPIDIVK